MVAYSEAPCWACAVLVTKAKGLRRLQEIGDTMSSRNDEGQESALQLIRRSIFSLKEDIRTLMHTQHSRMPDVDVASRIG